MSREMLLATLLLCLPAFGQDPPTPPADAPAGGGGAAAMMGRATPEPEIKPYDKVITKAAKTSDGLFKVHQIGSKVYYEIPTKELGKDMLWVSQLAKTTVGAGYGGSPIGNRVVRWERRDKRVLLRSVSFEIVADEGTPISRAVKAANNDTIIMAFNIEALSSTGAPVIEVSRLFTTEVTEFSARQALRARGFDGSRSFIERVKPFPENINVEVSQTYTSPTDTLGLGTGAPAGFGGAMRPGNATVVVSHSMVKLPEKPMMPRAYDDRVGFFSIRQQDYSVDEHRAATRSYITRWRLEKKDPAAALSEPVKPIVYWVDPATPSKWVPYIKKGIEAWQPAFEEAGFKHAIIAKEAPSVKEDPDWSPEDVRYSVIRWMPSTIQNAVGPNVHDPRTGEILDADVQMYHNIMMLQRDWYFTQVGAVDKRAQKLPLPDDLMGELIQYVVTHEVGHTLGFQHNMKASSLYPIEKLRDKEWLAKMGHTPTLMDYSRFNYLVQPEDGVDPELLIPRVGPYDKFATAWGYKPIPEAKKSSDEKATLDSWLKVQETTPWLRFSTPKSFGSDPGENTEAVGDADAIQATTLGTKNIRRVMDILLTAVEKNGENYDDLADLYTATLGQWQRELGHVAALVGGFDSTQKHVSQDGVVFAPVPKARQKAAVKFLNEVVFNTPTWAIKPEILRRIESTGEMNRLLTLQRGLLSNLMSAARISRLEEQEALDGDSAYRPIEFLGDVREGVFTELSSAAPKIDPYRRNLQRAYLEVVNDRLNGRAAPAVAFPAGFPVPPPVNANDDTRALLRGELMELSRKATAKAASTPDRLTKLHLEDIKDRVAKILDPKVLPQAPTASPLTGRPTWDDETCWPDLRLQ